MKTHHIFVFSNDADLFEHPLDTSSKFFPFSKVSADFGCPTILLKVHFRPQLHWRPSLLHQETIGPEVKWSPCLPRRRDRPPSQDLGPCMALVTPPDPVFHFSSDEPTLVGVKEAVKVTRSCWVLVLVVYCMRSISSVQVATQLRHAEGVWIPKEENASSMAVMLSASVVKT